MAMWSPSRMTSHWCPAQRRPTLMSVGRDHGARLLADGVAGDEDAVPAAGGRRGGPWRSRVNASAGVARGARDAGGGGCRSRGTPRAVLSSATVAAPGRGRAATFSASASTARSCRRSAGGRGGVDGVDAQCGQVGLERRLMRRGAVRCRRSRCRSTTSTGSRTRRSPAIMMAQTSRGVRAPGPARSPPR